MTQNAKILIVDDEPFVLDAPAHILTAAGYTIYTAASGAEGIRLARAEQPDLILLDVMLPDDSGIDICRTLKADAACQDCMVLLMSAQETSSNSQTEGLEVGADGYIARPVSNRGLLARIQVLLRVKQAEDELRRHQEHLEETVALRTAELQEEIATRKQAQQQSKLNESRLQALLTLNQKSSLSLPDVADFLLDKSILLTQSQVGFLGFLTPDEQVCKIHAWSEEAMQECGVKDRYLDFVIADSGIWGACVRQRAPFVLNDYMSSHPLKRGVPEGHIALTRFLAVPLFEDGQVASILAVGNKGAAYDDADIRQLTLLGDGMIRLLQKRRVQQELRQAQEAAEEARNATEKANQQLQEQHVRIQQQNAELHEVISKKDKFFSIVAHDIKNPISLFASFVNLFSSKFEEWNPTEMAHLIESLRGNVENLSELLDNLLAWAHLEQGRLELHPQKFDVEMLGVRNISLLNQMASQKQITLHNFMEKPMPAYADLNTSDTVMRNLLTNALKFTRPGGEVTISAVYDTEFITITVADTGIGMSAETLDSIFRIDIQHHKVGTSGERGTGLGLILCKEFVEKNGGSIWAESVEDQGTTFSFTVPSAKSIKEKV